MCLCIIFRLICLLFVLMWDCLYKSKDEFYVLVYVLWFDCLVLLILDR